jgi:predicted dehydrogenase
MGGKRIGLIGCGGWGRHILRDLAILGARVEVVARSPDSIGRARRGGADVIVPDIAGLGPLDGVVVATPTSTHAEVLDEALGLGTPVFVEKPLVMARADADELAERAPDRLFVMDKWRHHPGIQELASLAASGRLGTITQVQTRRLGWGNHHPDVDMFWTLAPHDLSIVLEILGRLPAASAAAGEVMPGGLVDFVGILQDEEDGPAAHVNVSARHSIRDRSVRVHGTEAVAVLIDAYADSVAVLEGHDPEEPSVEHIEISTEWPLLRELRTFLEHLDGGPPPKSSAADGALIVHRLNDLRALAGFDR